MNNNNNFCLFLGDLSLFCTEKDILTAFSPYGRVTNVRIKRSNENKKHLLYGFVEYASAAEAVQAMQAMNGALFLGRNLKVRWASNKQGKRIKLDETPQNHGPSVFVVFLVYNKQLVVTEAVLRSVFESFGPVDDVVVKQSKTDPMTGQQKGYAFVQFVADWAGIDAAYTAVANLDNFIIDGVGYKCEVSYNTEELRRQLLVSGSAPSSAGGSGGLEVNAGMRSLPAQPSPLMMSMAPAAPPLQPISFGKPAGLQFPAPSTPMMTMNPSGYKIEPPMAWGAVNYPPALYHSLMPPSASPASMGMGIPYFFEGSAQTAPSYPMHDDYAHPSIHPSNFRV